jgi:prepilin-type N-terminal cleavage/methylation domain-containing protein
LQEISLSFKHTTKTAGVRAYTLAEVLVAIAVIGIMVISLYAGFSSGFAIVRLSREEVRASQIIQDKLEAIRLCTWSQLDAFPTSFQASLDPFATNKGPQRIVYWGTVSLAAPETIPDNAPYKPDLRQVTIAVTWTNHGGSAPVTHTNRLSTLVARYGSQNHAWGGAP